MRASRTTPQSMGPLLVVLSAGWPVAVLHDVGFRRARGFPRGVYHAAPWLKLWIVVIRELPPTGETLLLRLMALGRCSAELSQSSSRSQRTRPSVPWRSPFWFEITEDPAPGSAEDEEFLMSTHDIVEAWKQQWLEWCPACKRGFASALQGFSAAF